MTRRRGGLASGEAQTDRIEGAQPSASRTPPRRTKLGRPCAVRGRSTVANNASWRLMATHGASWRPMAPHGAPWRPMRPMATHATHGGQWRPTTTIRRTARNFQIYFDTYERNRVPSAALARVAGLAPAGASGAAAAGADERQGFDVGGLMGVPDLRRVGRAGAGGGFGHGPSSKAGVCTHWMPHCMPVQPGAATAHGGVCVRTPRRGPERRSTRRRPELRRSRPAGAGPPEPRPLSSRAPAAAPQQPPPSPPTPSPPPSPAGCRAAVRPRAHPSPGTPRAWRRTPRGRRSARSSGRAG
jgi:hypothetical protein